MLSGEWGAGVGSREWGVGSGERGVGSREWGDGFCDGCGKRGMGEW